MSWLDAEKYDSTLRKYEFRQVNPFVWRRNKDSAHIGTIPNGLGSIWAITIYHNKDDGTLITEVEPLEKFLQSIDRQNKLERILQ
jgi:hypothetical protein